MQASLFSEFNNTYKNAWNEKVAQELKGDLSKLESWEIADGIFSESYYTHSEVPVTRVKELHQAQKRAAGWLNLPSIRFQSPKTANAEIKNALTGGADGILLNLGKSTLPQSELIKTLHQVRLTDHFIFFSTNENPVDIYEQISKGSSYYLKGGIACDPVASYLDSPAAVTDALKNIGSTILKTRVMKDFRSYMIEGHLYHEAGADAVQELAFTISSLAHCIDYLTDQGVSPLLALNRFFFSVSVGSDYLVEIAKLRALRLLYRNITRAYKLPDELCNAFIHVKTSYMSHADSATETNIIRATIQAMAAVNGGCDALTVDSHDVNTGESGDRIAQNISLLISAESHGACVADPAAGSYLVDNISLKLADQAWTLFLSVENRGGILACYQNGFVQNEIEHAWAKKLENLKQHEILVGVNKYQENGTDGNKTKSNATYSEAGRALPRRNLADAWNVLFV